jgi:beta-barrel assembly-enhancing protease
MKVLGRLCLLSAAASLLVAAASPPQLAGSGYVPQDKDERGLWMQMEEAERDLKHSTFVMQDPALNTYVRDVFCRTVGQTECKDVRLYIMRTPYFNASMAPNGLMQVYSGLFLRTRNEAQLAAILGHEYTHYRNRHSIQLFRAAKSRLNTAAWFGAFGLVGSLVQIGIVGSFFTFSREMEAEADAGSVPMLTAAGYDPHSASLVWEQLRAEMDATAVARNKKSRKDKNGGMFASHPPTAERMTVLKAMADKAVMPGPADNREAAYRKALAPYWADFVDDQIKLNDFGATDFLLQSLAKEGWTPELSYARGELYRARGRPEDLPKAAEFYRAAVAGAGAPVEAWRGLGLALLRSGVAEEGKAALKNYLTKRPDASDKAMMAMLAGG